MSSLEKKFISREAAPPSELKSFTGVTTFATMACILAVNPAILSESGMEFSRVFAATAISAAIASLIMGLVGFFVAA